MLRRFRFHNMHVVRRVAMRTVQQTRQISTKPRNVEVPSDDCLPNYDHIFRPDLLEGKTAFITGGGSGIGFRIAEIFMRHGCDTAIASRRLDKVKESAEKLEFATGRKCLPLSLDVRHPDQVESTVDEIMAKYQKIDILVNSAAGNFLCAAENLSYNAFKTVIDIDTIGTFNCSKAVFDKCFKKHGGDILNISATLYYKGDPFQLHAGSAKAAIDAMTKHMAVEWGPNGVRVNCIAPGPIDGTIGMNKLGGGSEILKEMINGVPLKRMGQKSEIADAAVFLVSNAAAYVTGAVLVVDGGHWMSATFSSSVIKAKS